MADTFECALVKRFPLFPICDVIKTAHPPISAAAICNFFKFFFKYFPSLSLHAQNPPLFEVISFILTKPSLSSSSLRI